MRVRAFLGRLRRERDRGRDPEGERWLRLGRDPAGEVPAPANLVAESQLWSGAEGAVALRFDNPRATVLALVLG